MILFSFWHSIARRELRKTALGLLRILGLTVSEFAEQYPGEKLSVVTVFEVLEHQAGPAEFLERVKSGLRPRGYIAWSVPHCKRRQRAVQFLGPMKNRTCLPVAIVAQCYVRLRG